MYPVTQSNATLTGAEGSLPQSLHDFQTMVEFVFVSIILFAGIAYTILHFTTPSTISYTSMPTNSSESSVPRDDQKYSFFPWPVTTRSSEEKIMDEEEGVVPAYENNVGAYYGNLIYEKPRTQDERVLRRDSVLDVSTAMLVSIAILHS